MRERALSPEVDANAFAIAERQTLTGARGRLEGQEASQADAGELRLVAAVQGAWKFVWSEDGSDELYQLRNDPYEQHNLIGQRPEREARMRMLVERFNRTTPIAVLPSEPVPNQGNLMDALGYGGGED